MGQATGEAGYERAEDAVVKPPMPYAGGKQRLADWIVSLLPAHHHYVEPFAGGLSVLLAKPVSVIETVNDIDGEIMNFWAVLRDQPIELERVCALTPHSRAEYNQAVTSAGDTSLPEVERARRLWVRLTQGRGAQTTTDHAPGWRFVSGTTQRVSMPSYLSGYVERFSPVADRLSLVSLECRDALAVIQCYDRPGTVMYIDPPYLSQVRASTQYRCEMGDIDQHLVMLDVLRSCQSQIVLSGYQHPLYDQELRGWLRIDRPGVCVSGASRTESVWLNYDPGLRDYGVINQI